MSGMLAILLVVLVQVLDPVELARRMRSLRHDRRPEAAIELLEGQGEARQLDTRVLGEQVQALLDLGRMREARGLMRDSSMQQPLTLPLLVARLRLQLPSGDAEKILGTTENALRQVPDNVDLHCVRVAALTQLERWRDANAALNSLPAGCPQSVATLMRVGVQFTRARLEMEDDDLLEQAVPRLESALKTAPERVDVRSFLVLALARFHRIDQAEAIAQEGLQQVEGRDRAHLLYALGVVHRLAVRPQAALSCFEEALQVWPDAVQAEVGLARSQILAGRLDQAVARLKRCLEREPTNVKALLALAEAELRNGRPGPAAEALRTALKVAPSNLKVLYMLSRALAMQGDYEGSAEMVARYAARKQALTDI